LRVPNVRVRVAVGLMSACVTAVALYALLRILQFFVFPEPNPALVIWSAHAGYFWRVWTVAYLGGMAGFLAFAASVRDAARVVRALLSGLTVAAALIAVQGVFVP
jgi:hypothetical protein